MFPDLIVAGVVKSGTTSLFSYLVQHPDICGSARKETCHFLSLRYGESLSPAEEYEVNFSECDDESYIIESTPGYFYGGEAVAFAIKDMLPDVRIVICLREPVDRLISFFRYKKSALELPREMTLEEYLDVCEGLDAAAFIDRQNDRYFGVEGGRYSDYIEPWNRHFAGRIKIVFFDDLRVAPKRMIRDILSWTGMNPVPCEAFSYDVENRTLLYRSKSLQAFALAINRAGEPFLRRNRRIKKLIRSAYRSINSRHGTERYSEHLKERMGGYYSETNEALGRMLRAARQDVPEWL